MDNVNPDQVMSQVKAELANAYAQVCESRQMNFFLGTRTNKSPKCLLT